MCGLVLKCAGLIVMIHAFRLFGRLAGPRWRRTGTRAAEHDGADADPLWIRAGHRGRDRNGRVEPLGPGRGSGLAPGLCAGGAPGLATAGAIAAAVTGYLVVAATLGCMPAPGAVPRMSIAFLAIALGTFWARRWPEPDDDQSVASLSAFQAMAVRTAIPAGYVLAFGAVERLAGPGWAGLASTFPSMSLVVLAVTHLEAGPAEASRIARVLPLGNSSMLAFLATFYLVSLPIGLAGATLSGYVAALSTLMIIERYDRITELARILAADIMTTWRMYYVPAWRAIQAELGPRSLAVRHHRPQALRYLVHRRTRHRGRFAPGVEMIAW